MNVESGPARGRTDEAVEVQTSNAILTWADDMRSGWHYIAPGKPQQNGYNESFNVKRRPTRTPYRRPRGTPLSLRFERRCAEPSRSAARRRGVRRLRFSRPGGGLGEVEQGVER